MPSVREYAGLHQYDGRVQDLSPQGVATMLAAIGHGATEPDAHDETQLRAVEAGARAEFEKVEAHRWNPLCHLENLDLACYDREYAPAEERAAAKRAHFAAWPDTVDGAIESLDEMPAPVAVALLPAVRGLTDAVDGVDTDQESLDRGRAAADRLIAHLEQVAQIGSPDASLGSTKLASLLGDSEAMAVDLGRLEEAADAERARLRERLVQDCARLRPGVPVGELVAELFQDHPDDEGIYAAAAPAGGRADRLHHRARPSSRTRRNLSRRACAAVTALRRGNDVLDRRVRGGRAGVVLREPTGP